MEDKFLSSIIEPVVDNKECTKLVKISVLEPYWSVQALNGQSNKSYEQDDILSDFEDAIDEKLKLLEQMYIFD